MIVGCLVLSGFGTVALECDMETYNSKCVVQQSANGNERDYTHTVFVEIGSTSTCPACPASNTAWHTIYGGGNYNFEYCEMVVNKNPVANSHLSGRNLYWVPTSYWDGGEYVYPGTNYNTFYNYLDSSGARTVPDLVADLNFDWLGNAQLDISFNITNSEAVAYPGHLRVYITELESTLWNDQQGNPFYHAFLDFAFNQAINIPAGDTYSDSAVWDGVAAGYPGISVNNIQIILAVFDDTPHQSYSDPPSGAPFWAYYVDEIVAARIEEENEPPDTPEITGPTSGSAGTECEYAFNAEDLDGDDVRYHIDWGDDNSETTAFSPSGTDMWVKHTWSEKGTYIIKATAEDTNGLIGPEATLEVSIPKTKLYVNTPFLRFLQNFPQKYPLIYQLLQQFLRL